MFAAIFVPTGSQRGLRPRQRSHGSAAVGAALHESGFELVGAEERSYASAA